jgi:aspartate-semialdehyde dehydrogenase
MKTVAIVGATGAVGREFAAVLERRRFPAKRYRLFASERSAGRKLDWPGGPLTVEALGPESFDGVDIALFSAGAASSRDFAPRLVVPEINPQAARSHKGIIANPNCSTIIMAVPLWPLHQARTVRRVVVSTYQAASGAGARAMQELESQSRDALAGRPARPEFFPHPCAFNVFSHNTAIGEDGYNVEETKLIAETRKIFGDDSIGVAPTCLRVPVPRAHLESVSVEFARPIEEDEARRILAEAPGLRLVDDRAANRFPMPIEAQGCDEILVGRIRRDPSVPDGRGLQFICCGDQLLKGAALNAVQIAELLLA